MIGGSVVRQEVREILESLNGDGDHDGTISLGPLVLYRFRLEHEAQVLCLAKKLLPGQFPTSDDGDLR